MSRNVTAVIIAAAAVVGVAGGGLWHYQRSGLDKVRAMAEEKNLAGGWQDSEKITPEITQIAEYAVAAIARKEGAAYSLKQVVSARQQVVAGMNYRLLLDIAGAARPVEVTVWKKLDGSLELTSFAWQSGK